MNGEGEKQIENCGCVNYAGNGLIAKYCQTHLKENISNNNQWEKEFDEYIDKYSLFENENYSDHMPYDLQKKTVKDFIRQVTTQAREEERKRIVEMIEKLITVDNGMIHRDAVCEFITNQKRK